MARVPVLKSPNELTGDARGIDERAGGLGGARCWGAAAIARPTTPGVCRFASRRAAADRRARGWREGRGLERRGGRR